MTARALLDRRRAQLGASILPLGTGDRAVARAGEGWWLVLTGTPGPEGNTGMVFSDDAQVLREVVTVIERSGLPTELWAAGAAPDHLLTPPWSDAGSVPFMAVDLAATPTATDARVRTAAPADLETVVDLLVEAFGLDTGIAAAVVRPALGGTAPLDVWLLEHAGAAVSTVMTARYEDVVTVWCMATPPGLARRGFGRALLAHVLASASGDGATVGLLCASPAGEPLYRSTGWRTLEDWRVHVYAPPVQSAH